MDSKFSSIINYRSVVKKLTTDILTKQLLKKHFCLLNNTSAGLDVKNLLIKLFINICAEQLIHPITLTMLKEGENDFYINDDLLFSVYETVEEIQTMIKDNVLSLNQYEQKMHDSRTSHSDLIANTFNELFENYFLLLIDNNKHELTLFANSCFTYHERMNKVKSIVKEDAKRILFIL